jgi:hypothetical protein
MIIYIPGDFMMRRLNRFCLSLGLTAAIHFFVVQSAFSGAPITGDYIASSFGDPKTITQYGSAAESPFADLASVVFGEGHQGDFSHIFYCENPDSFSFSYQLRSDNFLRIGHDSGGYDYGVFREDGHIFALMTYRDAPGLMFGIQKSADFMPETIIGEFIVCRLTDAITNYGNPDQAADAPRSALLRFSFLSNGEGTLTELSVSHGSPDPAPIPFTYSVGSDGQIRIEMAGEADAHGVVSSDGTALTYAQTECSRPSIALGIRKPTVISPSEFRGKYLMAHFNDYITVSGQSDQPESSIAEVYFDGAGSGKTRGIYDSEDGPADSDSGTSAVSYSLGADGRITFTRDDGSQIYGIVSSDCSLIAAVDTCTLPGDDKEPGIYIGIKSGALTHPALPLLLLDP